MADTGFDVVSYLMGRGAGGGGPGSADRVSYDGTTSGLSATNVQDAIDELSSDIGEVSQELSDISPELGSITFSASWSGNDPYTQTVTVTGVTTNSHSFISLQPSASQLEQLITDGVMAMVIENNSGILTAKTIGAAPSIAMTIQCIVVEVE